MSTNQYRGREETDKIDFGKKSVEEQKKFSNEKIILNNQNQKPENEEVGKEAVKKLDEERAKRLH